MISGHGRAGSLIAPANIFQLHLHARNRRFLRRKHNLHNVAPPFPVRWRLYVLLNRFGKRFPLVLKLKWRIIKWHVFPFIALSDLDKLLAVLTESQRSVGANHMAFVTRRAVSVAYCNRDTRETVLVSNEGGGGIVACLIVRARSD